MEKARAKNTGITLTTVHFYIGRKMEINNPCLFTQPSCRSSFAVL